MIEAATGAMLFHEYYSQGAESGKLSMCRTFVNSSYRVCK